MASALGMLMPPWPDNEQSWLFEVRTHDGATWSAWSTLGGVCVEPAGLRGVPGSGHDEPADRAVSAGDAGVDGGVDALMPTLDMGDAHTIVFHCEYQFVF